MQVMDLFEHGYHGYHGFPGFGRRLFTRSDHKYFAHNLEAHNEVQRDVIDWFVNALKQDSPNAFNEAAFREGGYWGIRANFQQRHFYYFAKLIKDVENVHKRCYLCNLVGDIMRRTNGDFQWKVWYRECDIPEVYRYNEE
jgi:hypothetical protein